jgi:phosphoserine phosphatase RsbU/P
LNVNPREPESVLSSLNNTFQMSDHNDMYFSMWYGVYNVRTKILNYACAGHPVPLMLSNGDTKTYLDTGNLLIGIMPNMVYKKSSIEIKQKSTIYLFSDGVYEIFKPDGEELSIDEFYHLLAENSNIAENELNTLNEKLKTIQSSDLFIDDFSIMKVILQ